VNATSVDTVQLLAKLVNFKLVGNDNDHEQIIRHVMGMFHNKQPVPREFITTLLDHTIAVQKQLPNVLSVNRTKLIENADPTHELSYSSNLTIVGDVHGQYADFARIFEDSEIGGYPNSSNQFIFNGDMVDRGSKALEIVTTLLLAKLLAPTSIHILRGNHETRSMSDHYGFAVEVRSKYDKQLLDHFQQFFDTLPIAAVVENAVFVVHGGIGPQCVNMTVAQINELNRFGEPDHDSVISEFLWSGERCLDHDCVNLEKPCCGMTNTFVFSFVSQ
jgi:serine/threonine-protein phosphatase 5